MEYENTFGVNASDEISAVLILVLMEYENTLTAEAVNLWLRS